MTHIIDSNIVFTMLSALLSYCTMLLVLCHTTLLVPILYLPCCQLRYYITMLLVLCCTMLLVLYCHYLYHVVGLQFIVAMLLVLFYYCISNAEFLFFGIKKEQQNC